MSLKYVIINDLSSEKREFAIVFPDNVLHYMFQNLNPISSGIFDFDKLSDVKIIGGSSTLHQEPRYGYDEMLVLETLKNAKYFIVISGVLDLESAIIFHRNYRLDFKLLNWLKPISEGNYNYSTKTVERDVNNNFRVKSDNVVMEHTLKYGICLL